MAAFREILPESPGTTIAQGDVFAGDVRTFLVPAQNPVAALERNGQETDDSGIFFPNVGDSHPQIPYLRASSFRVRGRTGSGDDLSWLVDVGYSLDGQQFNFPPPDKGDPLYRSVAVRTSTVEVTLPIVSIITATVVGPPIGPSITETDISRFVRNDQTLRVPALSYVKETTVQVFGIDQVNAIANEHDKLHTFGGRIWRYIGGSGSQTFRSNVWTIRHEWISEPGTPVSYFEGSWRTSGVWNQTTIVEIPARLPHQQWVVRPKPVPAMDAGNPEVVAINVYPSNPNGWQTLPGISGGSAP